MEDYRQRQRQRYAAWKDDQKQREALRQEDEFVTSALPTYEAQGFDPADALVLARHHYQCYRLQQEHRLEFLQDPASIPPLYLACGLVGTQHYGFDLRLVMDYWFYTDTPLITDTANTSGDPPTASRPAPRLLGLDLRLEPSSWEHVQRLWAILNPYASLQYLTPPTRLLLQTGDDEPSTDEQLQDFVLQDATHCQTNASDPHPPFHTDAYYGALSVALPATLMAPLLHDWTRSDSSPAAWTVELCIPGFSPRVYAYCRNPDEHSDPGTVRLPWRLKYLLRAFEGQTLTVRVLLPPPPPPSPEPGFSLRPLLMAPDHVPEASLRQALNQSINHQRILFPGQVVLAHLDEVYGPLPFLVTQVYAGPTTTWPRRRPAAVINVLGTGAGTDCAVETLDPLLHPDHPTMPGFERYYLYLKNLQGRSKASEERSLETLPPPVIAASLRDQLFPGR